MDSDDRLFLHNEVLALCSRIRRRISEMQDRKLLDSLAGAFADAKLRTIHDNLRELLDFMDASEGW